MKDFEKCILGDGGTSRGVIISRGKHMKEWAELYSFNDVLMAFKTYNFSLELKELLKIAMDISRTRVYHVHRSCTHFCLLI